MWVKVGNADAVCKAAVAAGMNLRKLDANTVSVSFDETSKLEDVDALLKVRSGRVEQ